MRLRSVDPRFYEVPENVLALSTSQSVANANRIVRRIAGAWSAMGTGANDHVYCAAIGPDGLLYIGGAFTTANGVTVNRLAKWTGSTFATVGGTSCNGVVQALKFDAAGNLYITGTFTTAPDGTAANRIARMAAGTTTWSALGTGLNDYGYCLDVDYSGNVYVGGGFTTAGGTTVNHIAKWDGSTWAALGATPGVSTGGTDTVYSIAIARSGYVYVGGRFTTAGGVAAANIARWDGSSTWAAMGAGCTGGADPIVLSLVHGRDGWLYVGGRYTTAGGVTASNIARTNESGSLWETLGTGLTGGIVARLAINDNNNLIYAGGEFTAAGDITFAGSLASWNGSSWCHVDIVFPSSTTVYSIVVTPQDDMYIGFVGTGTATASQSATVSGNGSAEAWPEIHFKRSGGTSAVVEYLYNQTADKRLWLNYSLLDGEELVINLQPTNRYCRSSYFGNVWTAILRSSDLAEFSLLPGANTIFSFVNTAGSPTITAYMVWRNAHWAVDGSATPS
jgi:hypothetical protein